MLKPDPRYDVAVIGAGVNGAGIARDAAMRGLSVLLLEQSDICSGTSWASSRLIHGGLRYLEYAEIPLVFESLRERRTLRRIAPHLVKPLKLCIPIYKSGKRGKSLIRLGMLAYDLLSLGKSLPRHRMLSRRRTIEAEPGLLAEGLRGSASYYDAQVSYAERLVLENVLAAKAAGATIRTYAPVTSLDLDHDTPRVVYHDSRRWQDVIVEADVVINAAGPWVDDVLASTQKPAPDMVGGTKGSHIVVSPFEGAPADAFYVEAAADGRPFFIIPWNGLYLIGTTDIRFSGDPADARADDSEIDYLLSETNRVFPRAGLTEESIHYAYSGVRALPKSEHGPESAITRRHIITENSALGPGLVSIIGGKLTTYRELAEQAVDLAGKLLGRRLPPCRTHDTPLPGAALLEGARPALERLDALSEAGRRRLLDVYGGRAADIVALAQAEPELARMLDDEGRVMAAEIAYVAREEIPQTLADILYRRTMLGLDADQGCGLYDKVAAVAAKELGWDAEQVRTEVAALQSFSQSLRVS